MTEPAGPPRTHHVTLEGTVTATGALAVTVSTGYWSYWLDIAIEQLGIAAAARATGMAFHAAESDVSHAILPETKAAMVSTVGAAASIESFGKRVLELDATSKGTKPPDWKARDATTLLRTAFDVDEAFLDDRLKRLFDDRNAAVHAREEDHPPEPHPLGVSVGSGNAHFTFERALEAVSITLGVLDECCKNVRAGPEHARVAQMVEGVAKRLDERWERVKAAELMVRRAG